MATRPSSQRSSPFTAAELAQWRERLLAERDEAVADLDRLGAETVSEDAQAGDAADAAQSRDCGLATSENAQELVAQIDAALRRIDRADPCPFGLCAATGRPIERERLELMPWTPVCAQAAAT